MSYLNFAGRIQDMMNGDAGRLKVNESDQSNTVDNSTAIAKYAALFKSNSEELRQTI